MKYNIIFIVTSCIIILGIEHFAGPQFLSSYIFILALISYFIGKAAGKAEMKGKMKEIEN